MHIHTQNTYIVYTQIAHGQTGRGTDGQADGWVDGQTGRGMEGQTDGWMDGWMDGWTSRLT